MDQNQPNMMVAKNITKPDQATNYKTIYDVSTFEVFWRNFVAGAARALGGIVMSFFFLVIILAVINQYVMPHLQPLLDSLQTSLEVINRMNTAQPNQPFNQSEIQNLLRQINQ